MTLDLVNRKVIFSSSILIAFPFLCIDLQNQVDQMRKTHGSTS